MVRSIGRSGPAEEQHDGSLHRTLNQPPDTTTECEHLGASDILAPPARPLLSLSVTAYLLARPFIRQALEVTLTAAGLLK